MIAKAKFQSSIFLQNNRINLLLLASEIKNNNT